MVDKDRVENAVLEILYAIGEDPSREGLIGTPDRVARFYKEFFDWNPGKLDTAFENVQVNEMVIVRNIVGYSMCEHHILPFSFIAHVGYLPVKRSKLLGLLFPRRFRATNKVLGASKIIRVVEKHAHKLQIQERMTYDIAKEIEKLTDALGVGVIIEGRHLCMNMRGVRSPESEIVTSAILGEFHQAEVRNEFLKLSKGD